MTGGVVTFGEVMLRLSPVGFRRLGQGELLEATFGGGEANVAASLARFGLPVAFVSRVPANELGEAATAYVRGLGVDTDGIVRGGDRLGIYFLELGAALRGSKVVYDRSGSGMATIEPGMIDWPSLMAGARWFHTTGITPAISAGAAAATEEAIEAARRAGATVSVDLNYRAKLWRWGTSVRSVMERLVGSADVLFGNEEDADKVFGIRSAASDVSAGRLDVNDYASVCEQLHRRFPNLRVIALTLRGSLSASHNTWSGVAWSEAGFVTGTSFDISPIVDRVGAGDAFAAGVIYGLLSTDWHAAHALEFGIAAASLKHTIPGDVNLATRAEVEALMGGQTSGRIVR